MGILSCGGVGCCGGGLGGDAEESFECGLDGEVGGGGACVACCLEFLDVGFGDGELVFEFFGADGSGHVAPSIMG